MKSLMSDPFAPKIGLSINDPFGLSNQPETAQNSVLASAQKNASKNGKGTDHAPGLEAKNNDDSGGENPGAAGPKNGKGKGWKKDKPVQEPEPEEPQPEDPAPEEPSDPPPPPVDEPTPPTGDDTSAPQYAIDALVQGNTWSTTTINFAFMTELPSYVSRNGFNEFLDGQKAGTYAIFDLISQYTGLEFVETTVEESHIALGNANLGAGPGGYAYYPSGTAQNSLSGDVFINTYYGSQKYAAPGNFGYMTLLHEIGHAMGLEHPHEGPDTLPSSEDTRQYTVESYNAHAQNGNVEPFTFMTYDIATLQTLYGQNTAWATGNDVYDLGTAHNKIMTIWDGGGTDTLSAQGSNTRAIIDLNAGSFSSIGTYGGGYNQASNNIGIAYDADIENAQGGNGADTLVGNALNNVLDGGLGNDSMTGGGGEDVFKFCLDSGTDTVTDFTNGEDLLDFSDWGVSFSDLSIAESGGATTLSYGDDEVALLGINLASIGTDDIVFV